MLLMTIMLFFVALTMIFICCNYKEPYELLPISTDIIDKKVVPKKQLLDYDMNELIDEVGKKKDGIVGSYFIDSTIDNDYRDVITALNNISPNQQKIFNMMALPVTTIENDDKKKIIGLVNTFLKKINCEISKLSQSYDIINDYNNVMPMSDVIVKKQEKRGIDKFYEDLGVNYTLYTDVPKNSPVKLVDIMNVKNDATEHETRYIVKLVLKKMLDIVEKQICITVHFVIKNDPMQCENKFNNVENKKKQDVAIEYIFVNGFYTNKFGSNYESWGRNNADTKTPFNNTGNYYSFDKLGNEGITSTEEILKKYNRMKRMHEIEKMGYGQNIEYPIFENK